jgi:outer membrane immunogenic protein
MSTWIARLAFAAAALTVLVAPSFAADKGAPAAATVAPTQPENFNGPYIALLAGHSAGLIKDDTGFTSPRDGYSASAALGYNYRLPGTNGIVVGGEADIGVGDIAGTTNPGGFVIKGSSKWLGSVRGRVGHNAGSTMIYATGGVAMSNGRVAVEGVGAADSDRVKGWVYGAGLETFIFGPLGVRLEWLRYDWRGTTFSSDSFGDTPKLKSHDDHIRLGVLVRM